MRTINKILIDSLYRYLFYLIIQIISHLLRAYDGSINSGDDFLKLLSEIIVLNKRHLSENEFSTHPYICLLGIGDR